MSTAPLAVGQKMEWKKSKSSGAYNALLLFTFIYYTRPEDLIPVLNHIPLEKILGGIALIALISSFASGALKRKLPLELKLLMLLFAHLVISIPFAFWRGGAFVTVFERFSKTVIISFLVTMLIEQFDQLRRLLWVQAASMVVTTISSILIHHTDKGRLIGALGGIFENPNDLAINISINWPLCLGFLLAARSMGKKVVWGVGVIAMLLGVILTYSRSGLLAMMMAVGICLWEFGIKGKRIQLIIAAVIIGFVGLGAMFAIPHYITRVESLFKGNIQGSEDHGSLEARKQVLILAIMETIHHPVFGIGAGNFGAASGTWRVTHNTYMEIAAEGGLPAVILFVSILVLAQRNIRRTRSLPAYRYSAELRLFTGALWASLSAFMVGALFASFEYHLFPYYMVAYSSVLYRLARERSEQGTGEIVQEPVKGNVFWKRYSGEYIYAEDRTTAIDRTRR